MTIHFRSLPQALRRQVLHHPVFQDALLVARAGADSAWLDLHADELEERTCGAVIVADARVHLRRDHRCYRPAQLLADARSAALDALAAACGRTVVVRRKASLTAGERAIEVLERELASYCTDERLAHRRPPLVLPAWALPGRPAALASALTVAPPQTQPHS